MAVEMVHITRPVQAWRYMLSDDDNLPEDVHAVFPEVRWSADRKLVYFTYGTLRCHQWISVDKFTSKPDTNGGLSSWVEYQPPAPLPKFGQGSVLTMKPPRYFRELYPFNFWSVKSESSVKNDHRAVMLDIDDEDLVALWHDYCSSEQWPNPLPRFVEHRTVDGQYGRGYKPTYAQLGDWLIWEKGRDVAVMGDEEYRRVLAPPYHETVPPLAAGSEAQGLPSTP